MKGTVVGVSGDRCAVETASGITIFECRESHSTELGDVISGNLESAGFETLVNHTRNERVDVAIEDWSCTPDLAHEFLYG